MPLLSFYDAINWPFHYFFMGFFLVMGCFLWYRGRREERGWQTLSKELDLDFQETADSGYRMILARFELFGGGSLEQLTQLLSGKYRGWKLYAFNWFYRSDFSLQAVRGGFACVILELPRQIAPFRLFPQSFDNYLSSLDADRIVIGPEEFNQRFRLACKGRQSVDLFFHPAMIQRIMAGPDLLVEASGNFLLVAWEGELMPDSTRGSLDQVIELANQIPTRLLGNKKNG